MLSLRLAIIATMLVVIFIPGFNHVLAFVPSDNDPSIVIAVDLVHGESDEYLRYIQGNISWVTWRIITNAITNDVLEDVDILIIGQPLISLSLDEMNAIQEWLKRGSKVLWVAGDSDFGNGPDTQTACNNLLEFIGAKLRLELASVYDDYHNAGAFYRVLTRVMPDNIPELYTNMMSEGIIKPILMHGPDAVIWVDENGNYHDPVTETFPGFIRIIWSYDTAYISDDNAPSPLVYDLATYGEGTGNHTFVMVAAEYWSEYNDLIVVSGETPYGSPQPMYSWKYHGVELDGPQFIKNMIRWFEKIIIEGYTTPLTTPTTTQLTTTQGNTRRVDDWEITIVKVAQAPYINSDNSYYAAEKDHKIVITTLRIMNLGSETERIPDMTSFVLVSDARKSYGRVSEYNLVLLLNFGTPSEDVAKNAITYNPLDPYALVAPNTMVEGDVMFQIPLNESPVELRFKVEKEPLEWVELVFDLRTLYTPSVTTTTSTETSIQTTTETTTHTTTTTSISLTTAPFVDWVTTSILLIISLILGLIVGYMIKKR